MDIQSAALNELFVLYPVIIQGWISPVRPAGIAAGGIPKALYDAVPAGLECLVDPWTEMRSGTLAVDDRVDLYVNDGATPVHGKTINPGEEQLRIRLYVPHGELQDGVNTLHYVVTRPGGNGSEKSRVLEVLYHLRGPGEPAPAGMRLQIPAVVRDQGVDAEQAAQGVVFGFDYANRRAYDRIRLTLGTVPVNREVDPGEVGPGLPVITQTLFTDTFRRSGDNPDTLVFYSVVDQLGNRNQSADDQIDVHLDRVPSLQPPSVKEASGNNLNPVAAKDRLTAVLPADLLPTDQVSVTWTGPVGSPAEGSHTTLPRPISEAGHEIQLPNTLIAFCLGKQATLSYTVTRGGTPIPSPSFPVNVQTLPISELRPPMLKQASNNGEGPELQLNELTAEGLMWFPGFAFIAVNQPVWLRLKGTKSNGDVYDNLLWYPPAAHINQDWVDNGFFEYAAPYADLKDLKDGTSLTMEFKVGFGRSTNEAEAVSFQVRSYTVKAVAATALRFTNEPYLIAPRGQVKNLELSLRTSANQPVPGVNVTVELPPNVTYADGGSGARDFITQADGTVTVRGVKGHTTPGTYTLDAISGQQRVTADLTITPQGAVGEVRMYMPYDLACSRDGTRIYMCGVGGYIHVIDALSVRFLTGIYIQDNANYIAVSPDDTRLYVSLYSSNTVMVIDTSDLSIIASIPVGLQPSSIAFSSDGARAYVLNMGSNSVTVINTESLTPVASISIPTNEVYGLAISPDDTRLYTMGRPSGLIFTLYVMDTKTLTNIHSFPISSSSWTTIIVSLDGRRAYLGSGHGNAIEVIDTASGGRIKSIPVSSGNNGNCGFALNADGTRLYATPPVSLLAGKVVVIDTVRLEVIDTLYSPSDRLYTVALSPDETRLAVCVRDKGLTIIANR